MEDSALFGHAEGALRLNGQEIVSQAAVADMPEMWATGQARAWV